jgi:hypothetical protein
MHRPQNLIIFSVQLHSRLNPLWKISPRCQWYDLEIQTVERNCYCAKSVSQVCGWYTIKSIYLVLPGQNAHV